MTTSDDSSLEAVGRLEPCDWCGRPGSVRLYHIYEDDRLVCRNPALCDVCFTVWNAPGEVLDAFEEYGIDFDSVVGEPMEKEFRRRWREKVASGLRQAE